MEYQLFFFLRGGWASLIAQLVKNLPALQETLVGFLGRRGRASGEGIGYPLQYSWVSLVAGEESACNAGDMGL